MSFLSGGYNLHRFCDALRLVTFVSFIKQTFYCATIAYHVGLNANLGGHRTLANEQEKWAFGFDQVRGFVYTIAVSFGNSSFFPPYWKVF